MNYKGTEVVLPEPVLQVLCEEPEGDIVRKVYPMAITYDNLHRFWDQIKIHRNIFNHEVNNDFQKFVSIFLSEEADGNLSTNGLFWVVDDFIGVFYVNEIRPGRDAHVHFAFFDKRLKGRRNLCKEMINYAFTILQFNRISVEIPLYASPQTFNFVEALGFVSEGFKHSYMRYDGKWFDVKLYVRLADSNLHTAIFYKNEKDEKAQIFGHRFMRFKEQIEKVFGNKNKVEV